MAEITIRIPDVLLKLLSALLIVLLAVCITWTLFHLWSTDFFEAKYHLRLPVTEITGLNVGAPVRVDEALQVGKLERIDLADKAAHPDRKFDLVLLVEKRYQDRILSDSTGSVRVEGLLGQKFVDIVRGSKGAPLADNAEIPLPVSTTTKLGEMVHSFSFSRLADCFKEMEGAQGNAAPGNGTGGAAK
jgi:ABC-type transporter Mla subunit MlaD